MKSKKSKKKNKKTNKKKEKKKEKEIKSNKKIGINKRRVKKYRKWN